MKPKYLFICLFFLAACAVKKNLQSAYGTFTDERDGHVYKTVKIGKQIWMAQNLNFNMKDTKYFNDRYFGPKYYNNIPENGETYGMLYSFDAAKLAVPKGWHLPSALEWQQLQADCPDPVKTLNILYAGEFGTGKFKYLGSKATFYTSTADGMPIITVYVNKDDGTLRYNRQGIGWHLSLRLVKDQPVE